MVEIPGEKTLLTIPSSFYDLICRIAPGGMFIGLYWKDFGEKFGFKDASFLVISFAFIMAWVIGTTLESLGLMAKECLRSYWAEPQKLDETRRFEITERSLLVKLMAERVFFRSLAIISFITILRPPTIYTDGYRYGIGFIGFLVALTCMVAKRQEYDDYKRATLKHCNTTNPTNPSSVV